MKSFKIFRFGFSLFLFGILALNAYSETPVHIPSLAPSQPVLSPLPPSHTPPPVTSPPPPPPPYPEEKCTSDIFPQHAATCDDCTETCDSPCEGYGDFPGISVGCTTSPTFVTCYCCCLM